MVQLDGSGCVIRINQRFLGESRLPMDKVIGRRLMDLLADPDPRITRQFISRLLQPSRGGQYANAG
jgi:hypothetical protein